MGKKMKLPFPFIKSPQDQQWPWPSCGNSTKTLSFRSTYISTTATGDGGGCDGMGTTTESGNRVDSVDDSLVIQEVMQSHRLNFTPGETNSILEEGKRKKKENGFVGMKEIKSVVMEEMVSTNPYVDFRKSMEEMVEANQGLKGSMQGLQELLSCYLTVNGKNNHGYIVCAFADLLTSFSVPNIDDEDDDQENENNNVNINPSSSSNSPISALSFTSNSSSACTSSTARSTTPCLSCSVECSVEEEEGSTDESETSSEKTLVVVQNNDSPSCSSQL